jgi:hypothetical protein
MLVVLGIGTARRREQKEKKVVDYIRRQRKAGKSSIKARLNVIEINNNRTGRCDSNSRTTVSSIRSRSATCTELPM